MKSVIFALLASLVWGTAPVLFKLGLRGEIPPVTALVFHNLSAFLLALSVTAFTGMKLNYPLKEVMLVAAGGIMSGFLGLLFFFKAVKAGDVSVVAPIASTSPLWGSLVAFLLLGEPFSLLRAFGILLVVCGIVLISLSSGR
ncbi:MAG: EamA family transporter [Aquificaceae bacterium]|uniref:EamA family transporter n=1 Tax=Hydrogenobacter sp. Uz 6-8 TaxID=3384828 RepID=UPI0030A43B84